MIGRPPTTPKVAHDTSTRKIVTLGEIWHQGSCTCGWEGRKRLTHRHSLVDRIHHLRECSPS